LTNTGGVFFSPDGKTVTTQDENGAIVTIKLKKII